MNRIIILLTLTSIALFSLDQESIVKEIIDIPGVPKSYLLDETKSYVIQNGKQGGITYFAGSTFGIQIEPRKLGNIISIVLAEEKDGNQELQLLIKDGGKTKRHVIKFDESGAMNVRILAK